MNSLESLKNIFKDRVFKIPDYQRGYAWQKKQLKEFWEDILNLPEDRLHYTGLLSLRQIQKSDYDTESWDSERWLIEDRGFKAFHVVDGQQRLTTLVILINEIVNLVKKLQENQAARDENIYLGTYSLKQIKEEYLVIQKPPQFIINSYRFGYDVDNPSFKYLKHNILGEPNGGPIKETFYTLNLENARIFFKDNLYEYYESYGIYKIEMLFKKITQNLMFNLHELEDDFDVFVAFETMNNRGKKLSNLELLKNRLIYLTTLYDENELDNDTRKILRKNINDAWKDIYYHLGRNKKNPLSDDEFLVAHWIMYFQYTRQKGDDYIRFLLDEHFTSQNVFNKIISDVSTIIEIEEDLCNEFSDDVQNDDIKEAEFTKVAKLSPKEISDYVKSLRVASEHWYNSFNPDTAGGLTSEEKLWMDRLNRIGIAYFRPLVVASFIGPNIESEDRVKLFKEIERFIFIVFRLGRALSTYGNSQFYKITKQLQNGEVNISDVCELIKNRLSEWINNDGNFEIEPFRAYMSKKYKNKEGFYSWNGLKYFLYEYECEKVLQNGNEKIDWRLFVKSEKDKVSIEHIYPQTPSNEYWVDAFKSKNKDEREFLVGSLGNLLPLSRSKNSSMQNDSFLDKKATKNKSHEGYSYGSHSEIEVSKYAKWGPEEILDRGMKLISFMERRWEISFEDDESRKKFLFLEFM